jgi:hypothetical protein
MQLKIAKCPTYKLKVPFGAHKLSERRNCQLFTDAK